MSDSRSGYPPELLRFIARFDRGEYWLAHEELEELWLRDRQDAYKGLIHMAAALLHAERRNWRGAQTKAESADRLLRSGREALRGFDVDAMLRASGRLRERLRALARTGAGDLGSGVVPRLAPLFEGLVDPDVAPARPLPYRARRHAEGYRPGRDPQRRGRE